MSAPLRRWGDSTAPVDVSQARIVDGPFRVARCVRGDRQLSRTGDGVPGRDRSRCSSHTVHVLFTPVRDLTRFLRSSRLLCASLGPVEGACGAVGLGDGMRRRLANRLRFLVAAQRMLVTAAAPRDVLRDTQRAAGLGGAADLTPQAVDVGAFFHVTTTSRPRAYGEFARRV
jgi:hypothetical protein